MRYLISVASPSCGHFGPVRVTGSPIAGPTGLHFTCHTCGTESEIDAFQSVDSFPTSFGGHATYYEVEIPDDATEMRLNLRINPIAENEYALPEGVTYAVPHVPIVRTCEFHNLRYRIDSAQPAAAAAGQLYQHCTDDPGGMIFGDILGTYEWRSGRWIPTAAFTGD